MARIIEMPKPSCSTKSEICSTCHIHLGFQRLLFIEIWDCARWL